MICPCSTFLAVGVVLLGAQLVGEAARVDHGLLGLLLRVLGVGHQVVDVGLQGGN